MMKEYQWEAAMAKLCLRGIGKVYPGNVQAERDFSLEIADRE
jgi:hypothetical protein